MKNYRLLALALCLLLLAACAKETPSPTEPVVTTMAPPATTAPMTTVPVTTTEAETTVPVAEIEVNEVHKSYVQQGTGTVLANVSLSVPTATGISGADAYYAQWLEDMRFYIDQDIVSLEDYLAEDEGPFYGPYEYDASFQVTRNDGVLLSIARECYYYTGGAHGGTSYWGETYIVESGARLSASDLFAVPFDVAMGQVYARVLEKMDAEVLDGLYGDDPEDCLKDDWDSADFYFTDTGVVFFWQEYAIAPYAAGPQIYELPYAEVADLLNPKWLP